MFFKKFAIRTVCVFFYSDQIVKILSMQNGHRTTMQVQELQLIMISLLTMRPFIQPLTELSEQRQITICNGQLFFVDHGNFILLTSPIVFKNGIFVTMDGTMNMPDGKTRKLKEGEYISTYIL